MMRHWWLGALVCFTLASALMARQGTVLTSDGRTLQGEIDESPGSTTRPVTITIHGVRTTIPRTTVVSVDYGDNVAQEFRDRMGRLSATDVQGRLDLASWALDRQQYSLANQAADSARRIDPRNPDVAMLLETIKRQQVLNSHQGTGTVATAPSTRPQAATTAPANIASANPGQYLNDDQINTIREVELRSDDNVRVQFFNDVRRRYLAGGGIDATQYYASSPAAQAAAIIRSGDRQMMRDIKILSDPAAIAEYRNRIMLRVEVGCAAAGCHGGAAGKSFYLYPDARSTAAVYTNFYILQTYKIKLEGGGGYGRGPAQFSMVDRIHPGASLLAQYGLPTAVANLPHPKAPGWRLLYNGQNDPFYSTVINWITNLRQIEPDYGFDFPLPLPKGTTRPSTEPDASGAAATPTGDAATQPNNTAPQPSGTSAQPSTQGTGL